MTDGNQNDWKTWRRGERQRLLDVRNALPSVTRRELSRRVLANLDRELSGRSFSVLGIYWPIKREIDLLRWAGALSRQRNIALALPVITTPRAPLEYWLWSPDDRVTRGVWNIPVPAEKAVAEPDLVIAPLVGFQACWRLGYGGGYFDRTLAARAPHTQAIGIGFDILETAHFSPQPHDVPMQAVVTESSIVKDGN